MKLTFWGAARTVTGSCHQLEAGGMQILVDCGLSQGSDEADELNHRDFPFNPAAIDYLLLTHAHIDHCGLIPKLCRDGFKGKILATRATVALCNILLLDSAHIQEMESEWQNRKKTRAGRRSTDPLYTIQDAIVSLQQFEDTAFNEELILNPNVRVRFRHASHILGAAVIEVDVKEDDKDVRIVFTGDLGRKNQPIIKDPDVVEKADYLVIESTYGNRLHEDKMGKREMLADIIREAARTKGKIIIPSFAVGRTQDLLYDLNLLIENQEIPPIPVFIDSPLAISATEIFVRHPETYDPATTSLLAQGDDPFEFPGLKFTRLAEESKALNTMEDQAIIISASGMCDAGRIKHHLKHNLWRPEATILFVGYQAKGTLGRRLLDGEKEVKIFGEEIAVKAKIVSIDGFSAHGDMNDLLNWMRDLKSPPQQVFIVHGEEEVSLSFATTVGEQLGFATVVPHPGESFAMGTGIAAVSLGQKALPIGEVRSLEKEYVGLQEKIAAVLRNDANLNRLTGTELIEISDLLRQAGQRLEKLK